MGVEERFDRGGARPLLPGRDRKRGKLAAQLGRGRLDLREADVGGVVPGLAMQVGFPSVFSAMRAASTIWSPLRVQALPPGSMVTSFGSAALNSILMEHSAVVARG